jgi:hypothetical protein
MVRVHGLGRKLRFFAGIDLPDFGETLTDFVLEHAKSDSPMERIHSGASADRRHWQTL